jgi:hypothetical protein
MAFSFPKDNPTMNAFSNITAPIATSTSVIHGTADPHERVLLCAGRFRVIVCRGNHPWIVQSRKPLGGTHERPWVARDNCRTKPGMQDVTKTDLALCISGLWDFVDRLAERISAMTCDTPPPSIPPLKPIKLQGTAP